DTPERLVYSLLNLGSVEVKLNHPAEALRLHEEAHALLGRAANIRLRADVVHALGIDLARLGRPDEARERLNQACEQYRQIGNTAKELEVSAFLKQMDSAVAGGEPAAEKEEV
ncbi:MAG: tetratricopeptide repeat protein, partial [Candidatus Promineofilum sp.]|nr:tetratricopeptide repeat protein [Promineifilum sp.]